MVATVMEFDPTRPKWMQVAEVVRQRIASGVYPLHHLISEVKLEREFAAARVTVRKVTAALRAEGLIVTTPGMGSFVAVEMPATGGLAGSGGRTMLDFDPMRPRWHQVVDVIRERISDGTYPPGERVPSVLQLQEEFGIANVTAHKVHRGLRAEALINTEAGLGSFVSRQAEAENTLPCAVRPRSKWEQIADEVRSRITSGAYPPRHLISEVKLEQEFGVARVTVRKATAALREEGWIVTTPGLGSFVTVKRTADGGPSTEEE
ncbi:GntR family transcriptional regulator [Streptomyces chrestomyceticus]|uniref:GntR family transcriptional regulator n=1 Tax=Streptomyces chrestomyceticus TaxID=68185 RepID=UPI0035A886C9